MNQTWLAKSINIIFITLAFSVVIFGIARKYTNAITALVIAIIFTIPVVLAIAFYKNKKLKKLGIKQSELAHAADCMKEFWRSDPKATLYFFLLVVNKTDKKAIVEENHIKTKKTAIFPMFSNQKVEMAEITRAKSEAKKHELESIIIFANDYNFQEKLPENIVLFNGIETYSVLKQKNIFPKISKTTKKRKNLLKNMIKRTNFKGFLTITFVFAIANFFVPQNFLYLFFMISSLSLAIVCLFSQSETAKAKPVPF